MRWRIAALAVVITLATVALSSPQIVVISGPPKVQPPAIDVVEAECTPENTTADAEQATVASAIAAASDGGTVCISADDATWTTHVEISGKDITLRGAGCTMDDKDRPTSCETIIRCDTSASNYCLSLGSTASRLTEVDLVFVSMASDRHNLIQASGQGWRVDHIKCTSSSFRVCVYAPSGGIGLVDHIATTNSRVLVVGGATGLTGTASDVWALPSAIGTEDAVYIEDSAFVFDVFGNAIDCNYGGRYVFRYNEVTSTGLEAHSAYATNRGCRSWEIYENDLYTSGTVTVSNPWRLRGGTGTVFNNRLWGNIGGAPPYWGVANITLDNRRSYESTPRCNGESSIDGNTNGSGWPCRDQIGRGQDAFEWNVEGTVPSQASEPAYAWGNTRQPSGTAFGWGLTNGLNNTVQAGSGTTTSATFNAACTGGGYTTNSPISLLIDSVLTYRKILTLSSCGFTFDATTSAPPDGSVVQGGGTLHIQIGRDALNEERPGYTPFTYPHPLQGS